LLLKMSSVEIKEQIEIPEGIQIEITKFLIKRTGPNGTLERRFTHPILKIHKKDNKLLIEAKKVTKREKRMSGTFISHIKNMIEGTKKDYEYNLKICSGHFPMSVSIEGNTFLIKNFLGEKVPRKAKILSHVKVEIKGNEIVVISNNLESAGQTAANIESATRITNKDRRRFQDGIYITKKPE